MRTILASSSLLLVAAASLVARRRRPSPAPASTQPVQLDAIVAIVGDQPITRFDLREQVLAQDPAQAGRRSRQTARRHARACSVDVLNDMIEEELLLQKAKDLKIEVADADITPHVDRQIKRHALAVQQRDANSAPRSRKASLGTPEEYRKYLMEQFRRQMTLDKTHSQAARRTARSFRST